ncbi:MAG: VIT domain-containing protein, partial [Proteobacteria bacterium]|nr:VIT domain-containing protein [Pseudomonadota bacterium]
KWRPDVNLRLPLLLLLAQASLGYASTDDLAYAGFLHSDVDGRPITLAALHSDYDIQVSGDIASVRVTQHFSNPTDRTINARYLFPLNRKAAVHKMTMHVGDETIQAVIQPVKQARETFAAAKQAGKAAALLEQHRPNMFTQQVGNLMPAQTISILIEYTHVVDKVAGVYELVVPTVVGPRFEPEPAILDHEEAGATHWQIDRLPRYSPTYGIDLPDTLPPDRLNLSLTLESAVGISNIASDTHQLEGFDRSMQAADGSTRMARLHLAQGRSQANRDFVLHYTLGDAGPSAGVLTHWQPEEGGYFSLLIEPPATLDESATVPREMVFLLDCSGSMRGLPLRASKLFVRKALTGLRPSDTFRIIRFSDSATEFSIDPLPATPVNIALGLTYLDGLNGSGGTVMTSGILQALTPPVPDGAIRNVVFLTDGYIGNEMELFALVGRALGAARLFTYGTGTSTNRYLLNELARIGRGFARYFDPTRTTDTAELIATQLAAYLNAPALVDISIDWSTLQPETVYPREIPDLYAGQSVRVTGRFRQVTNGIIRIKGRTGLSEATLNVPVVLATDPQRPAIRQIWARTAVAERMHNLSVPMPLRKPAASDDDLVSQATDLGLRYGIATRWTAFVAVSDKVYNVEGNAESAEVGLSKVAGVSSSAYTSASSPTKFTGYGAPEPGLWFSVIGLVTTFSLLRRRRRRLSPG